MDEGTQSFSPFYNQPESPKIYLPKPATSGLTLVIPSLKSLKAAQSTKNSKQREASTSISTPTYQDVDTQEKKPPRPIKLKPLKEVLTKLIAQIKKKDDYAFFLHPVDVANVQGYSDIIKRPMDFGTMAQKVNKGRYRSLEEFASDFKLVTSNAKIFNPPNTLYHTEADRIEAWGLEHISKASSTVIQYETDWNIDIEKDEDPLVNVDNDDDDTAATPMDVDNSSSLRERSVSVASQPQPGPSSRRGPRGPYKKQGQSAATPAFSETLEPDGGLPGSKDGLGAFPPGSDWAKTMVALKLKGKKYKTKKERLRIEREGPPLLPDGSLDYTEMEDPFSVLSFFVPEPLSRPHLVPLYPPLYNPPPPPPPPQLASEPSTSQTPQTPARSTPVPTSASVPPPASTSRQSVFPAATSIGPDHVPPDLSFLLQQQRPSSTANGKAASSSTVAQNRRRHWTINRNTSSRQKGKERDDDPTQDGAVDLPPWQMPREAHATDFGSFAVLAGALAEEMKKRGISSTSIPDGVDKDKDIDQEVSFDLIRSSVDCEAIVKEREKEKSKQAVASVVSNGTREGVGFGGAYWTDQRTAEAEEYLRDVVYGGVDGFGYVRSLAEFTDGRCYYMEDPSTSLVKPLPQTNILGMPLSEWVVQNIVDPLTDGRHSLLRETALELALQQNSRPPVNPMKDPRDGTVASQVAASLHFFPCALVALSALLQIRIHKIDMGSLIKTPNELFLSEEEWAGKGLKKKKRLRLLKAKQEAEAAAKRAKAKAEGEPMEVEEPEQTWAGVDASFGGKDRLNGRLEYEAEGPEELLEVLDYVANVIIDLDRRNRVARDGGKIGSVGPEAEKKPVATSAVNGFGTGHHGEKASGAGSGSVGRPGGDGGADVIMASDDDDERDDVDKDDEGADAAADGISMTKDRKQGQAQAASQPTSHKVQAGVVGVGGGAGVNVGGAGDGGAMSEEDPGIRNLRLNLLALAKRAPLDTIARLPKDLVPEHIRHFVPTLGSSG